MPPRNTTFVHETGNLPKIQTEKGCFAIHGNIDRWPLSTSDFEWLNVVSVGGPHPGKRPPGWIILKLETRNLLGMVTFRLFNAESESLTAASLQLFTSLKFRVSLSSASRSETTEGKFGNLGLCIHLSF